MSSGFICLAISDGIWKTLQKRDSTEPQLARAAVKRQPDLNDILKINWQDEMPGASPCQHVRACGYENPYGHRVARPVRRIKKEAEGHFANLSSG